jgi:heme/copper-type cytochrome/quinol oxidase subunit 4
MINKLSQFMRERKAYGAMIASMIGLVLAVILISVIVMPTIHGTNTSGWTAAEIALWGILGLLVIVGALQLVTGK